METIKAEASPLAHSMENNSNFCILLFYVLACIKVLIADNQIQTNCMATFLTTHMNEPRDINILHNIRKTKHKANIRHSYA